MSQRFERLKTLLKELFQLDQPDLDFGLYRIMHAKSAEVTQFLDQHLLPQVKEAFALYKSSDKPEIEKELAKAIEQAKGLGVDPESTQKVKDLRAKLKTDTVDIDALESEVYDHLYSFFRRYYSEGDFLSKRVYKPGVYAIPYEGEEVKLHWANADQYYIKTSEYLRDYAFRLRPDDDSKSMRVHFRLVDATEGEHGNVKEAQGKERRFKLAETDPVTLADGELSIRFTYQSDPSKQKDLNAAAEAAILAINDATLADWIRELRTPHRRSDGTDAGTRLRVHLDRYTARNTFDYFIHKDLGRFLRRELDFYIKNEVMHLDDVVNESTPRVEQYLSKLKVIRRIAEKIIQFLEQLEGFQKTLWLKKKFVVETSWCVRVSCIPEEFHSEIAANKAQHDEWVRLYGIDALKTNLGVGSIGTVDASFLSMHPSLIVDTKYFSAQFTERLLGALAEVHDLIDGLLIHGDNFQALALMGSRYRGRVKCIYIDPPYNTDAGPIDYKNGYRVSSWLSMIDSRLGLSRQLLSDEGVLCVTIDDYQAHELANLLDQEFGREHQLGTAVIRNNPSGRSTVRGLSVSHEYAFFYANGETGLQRLPRTEKQLERFSEENGVHVDWRNFRKDGGAVTHRAERPKQYYPIYVRSAEKTLRIPPIQWNAAERSWEALEQPTEGEVVVWPIDEKGQQRVWSFNHLSAMKNIGDLEVRISKNGSPQIYRRHLPSDGVLPRSWWDKNTYAAREYGSAALTQLFGTAMFSFAKSPYAVQDSIWVSGLADESDELVLDYFGGSGTTAHAIVNLNREDGGTRRFILVEQGDYFDTVLMPRVKKVAFAPEWKDGKAQRLPNSEETERSPRIVQVLRLESYEDALNNLDVRRSEAQATLLDGPDGKKNGGPKEQYILRYMLNVETRGSQSLLNVRGFADPTAYKLKVKRPGSDESREVNVDLIETFNWLIGLTVKHIAAPQVFEAGFDRDGEGRLTVKGRVRQAPEGPFWFRTVTGTTPEGRKTLVIWRKLTGKPEEDNLVLDEWFTRQGYSSKDSEFDLIYVNGGNNLENLKAPDDTWKVRLIEDDFHRLMFETDGN
jgi:adenine-specific DNA-methyltransferase